MRLPDRSISSSSVVAWGPILKSSSSRAFCTVGLGSSSRLLKASRLLAVSSIGGTFPSVLIGGLLANGLHGYSNKAQCRP